MSAVPEADPDPLIAALPPATDYITYLTLLEYQLTPQNLSTLNRLLLDDDGSLAKEIGWDLLKLVLPMLSDVPEEATRCLEIIARRGNPREVVVRIAEVLEKLGSSDDEEDGVDQDLNLGDIEDELPTFPGEAERIHLGRLTLQGMPPVSSRVAGNQEGGSNDYENLENVWEQPSRPRELSNLLNMLSILHPRIKTQYPSRFLATSLPAALRAYRRIPTSLFTTSSFISFLSKLSGKQRPILPPRTSTVTAASSVQIDSAMLPDPDASGDEPSSKTPSPSEKAIIQRLLQAVMLEVMDEFALSLQSQELPCMSWTVRLREKFEPERVVPGKPTETEKWKSDQDLLDRDELIVRLLALGNDLGLDIDEAFKEMLENLDSDSKASAIEDPDADPAGSPTEFPRSPSDIPFPQTGVLLIYTALQFLQQTHVQSTQPPPPSTIPPVLPILSLLYDALGYQLSSTATSDALLALLYLSVTTHPVPSSPSFRSLVPKLTSFSASSPDATLRNSAHAVATKIYHAFPVAEERLRLSKEIIVFNRHEAAMITAVATDWLKDEFLAFIRQQRQGSEKATAETGINPAVLDTDAHLATLLFPTRQRLQDEKKEVDMLGLQLQIPAWIASLNLFCVMRAQTELRLELAEEAIDAIGSVFAYLLQDGGAEVQTWTWALEDALGRAREAVAAYVQRGVRG